MNRIFLLLLTINLVVSPLFPQDVSSKKTLDQFSQYYNSGDYHSISSMYSDEMQSILPSKKNIDFLSRLKSYAGNITDKELIKIHNEAVSSYKISFAKIILTLDISINDNGQIDIFLLKPFKEHVVKRISYTNDLTNLSKEQSELIFSQIKGFPNNTQLAIAFIKNGDAMFYGVLNKDGCIMRIDNEDKVFEIGSISKVFTATLLANTVLEGNIGLKENINKYYNFPFSENINVPFESLANHTSGLCQYPSNLDIVSSLMHNLEVGISNPYQQYDEKKIDSYLKSELELQNEPYNKYAYSNFGFGLLGYTLEKVENTSYERLLQNKIFNKYGMLNSCANINQVGTGLVKGLDNEGNEIVNWEWNTSTLLGAGSILSTVSDLAKFALAQFDTNNKVLTMTRTPTFTINEKIKVGLGWHIITTENDKELYWHNGGTGGYSSSMLLDIENKNGVIILSNVSAFNPNKENIDNLCFGLILTLNK